MYQQQPPQTPPNPQGTEGQAPQGNVPDHRLEEIMQKMRTLELQNTQLRTQIDYMTNKGQQPGQPGQQQQQSPFKPEVQQAISDLVNQRLEQERTQFRQQIGMLYDQLDAVNFTTKYSGDKYSKFHSKVDQLRQEYQARNQYITREDALRMVYFEETGKKDMQPQPQPQAAPQPQAPVYDPYFQTWVDPQTGRPVPPQQTVAQEDDELQQPPPAQQPWAQAPQAPTPQAQPAGQFVPGQRMPTGSNHPHGNAYGQTFKLPNQGVNQPATPTHQAQSARAPLSLESSDDDLAAFEKNFGDIPL